MKLRIIPQLHFVYDESIERGSHLSQLIDQAVASDAKLIKE
jgi:ribosome-binding factor A